MGTYNDCYLFGFLTSVPEEKTVRDVWKAVATLCFFSEEKELLEIPIVCMDEEKKKDFLKRKPYDILSVRGHLQKHTDGRLYLHLLEYTTVGTAKTRRNAVLRIMGHTGNRVYLKGQREGTGLFVPRIGQYKNITPGDHFDIPETAVRGTIKGNGVTVLEDEA